MKASKPSFANNSLGKIHRASFCLPAQRKVRPYPDFWIEQGKIIYFFVSALFVCTLFMVSKRFFFILNFQKTEKNVIEVVVLKHTVRRRII